MFLSHGRRIEAAPNKAATLHDFFDLLDVVYPDFSRRYVRGDEREVKIPP
jgi:hypothetical protein